MTDIKQEFVETVTGVSVRNGVARLLFVGLDVDGMINVDSSTETPKTKPVLCTAMPFSGFLHTATIIEKFLRNESVQSMIRGMKDSGVEPDSMNLSLLLREEQEVERRAGKAPKANTSDAEVADAAE